MNIDSANITPTVGSAGTSVGADCTPTKIIDECFYEKNRKLYIMDLNKTLPSYETPPLLILGREVNDGHPDHENINAKYKFDACLKKLRKELKEKYVNYEKKVNILYLINDNNNKKSSLYKLPICIIHTIVNFL